MTHTKIGMKKVLEREREREREMRLRVKWFFFVPPLVSYYFVNTKIGMKGV